jgi:hypothetical protein
MKVLDIQQAQSTKVARTNGSYGYLPDVVKAVVERYQFIGYPQGQELAALAAAPDPNAPAKPVTFTQGKITLGGKLILIDNMQIYPLGVSVTTRSNTLHSDRVIEDAMQWASSQFNVEFEELRPSFGHLSQLDFRFEHPLPNFFPALLEIGRLISSKLEPFWDPRPEFELTGLMFFYDKSKSSVFSPPIFRIDRRAGHPFEHGVFWSDSGLSTDNHVEVLSELEMILSKVV